MGQLGTIDSAAKYSDNPPGLRAALVAQCGTQRIQSLSEVQSFSLLGILIVVCVTVVLMVLAVGLGSCVALLEGKSKVSSATVARMADDKLHLLRMALDGGREARWANAVLDVPVTGCNVEREKPFLDKDGLAQYIPPELEKANESSKPLENPNTKNPPTGNPNTENPSTESPNTGNPEDDQRQ
jgi:hypothetical protein